MKARRIAITTVVAVSGLAVELVTASGIPARLSDAAFWALTQHLSEPPGSFRSQNFVSNEREYQLVIPEVVEKIPRGEIYLGVGPEQNFTYIAALRPRMAFIIDIRRGNLLEHLLYKALFEMSRDRAEFLSRLFSRKRPPGLTGDSSVADLFAAYQRAEPTDALYQENRRAVDEWLTKKHHFPLTEDDRQELASIYRDAFFTGGPNLDYSMGGGDGGGTAPSYQELMLAEDGSGINRSYLANEANFLLVKNLQARNVIVPVVGDFGGPSAIRAIGRYVRQRGGTVAAFYVSNVEQYLLQDQQWATFCRNVATLPLDANSLYIFSGPGSPARLSGAVSPVRSPSGGGLAMHVRPIYPEGAHCDAEHSPAAQ